MKLKYIDNNKIINLDTNCTYILNSTARAFIDAHLNNENNENALKELQSLFNVDKSIIEHDYIDFLKKINGETNTNIGRLPSNNYVVLEPTNDCTAQCLHCFHRYKEKFSWSLTEIDNNIHLLCENDINSVSLTGGEVFSPHFIDNAKYLIKKLIENNINIVSISTNGMFLSNELIKWLSDYLDFKKLNFRISLDAVEKQDVIRLRPGYRNYYNNDFWKTLKKYNANITVTTVIYNQTSNEILKIAEFISHQSGVRIWLLKPLIPTKKEHFPMVEDWNKIKEIYKTFLDWFKVNSDLIKYNFVLGNSISRNMICDSAHFYEFQLNEHPCKDEKSQKTLKANGKITRCPILPEFGEKYLLSIDKLTNINTEIYDDLKIENMECHRCKYRKICGGGCRVYAIAYTGNQKGCDINSKKMWDWITSDNYFKTEWSTFYDEIMRCIK